MDEHEVAQADILARPVTEIDFTGTWTNKELHTRIYNSLQRAGIHTIGDLTSRTMDQVKDETTGMGLVSFVVLEKALKKMGLSLRS